ncbi:MAG TPA: hypothetical protein VK403_01220 [Allosphingosinicella sp.]|nr:hypothetical protein [Allosphingosinicella sp.]
MHNMIIGSGVAGLLLLGLSACSPEPSQSGASNNISAANVADNAGAPAPEPAPAARSPLVLEGAGLGIPDASPPRIVSFDTPKAATIEAVTRALGRPPGELGENDECPGGGMEFATWKDDIILWFESGRFAGWDNRGKLKTKSGIGIGSSRADVAQLAGMEVEESTLGTEFRAGGLSGVLASKAADAKVTHLWGGATCVFR